MLIVVKIISFASTHRFLNLEVSTLFQILFDVLPNMSTRSWKSWIFILSLTMIQAPDGSTIKYKNDSIIDSYFSINLHSYYFWLSEINQIYNIALIKLQNLFQKCGQHSSSLSSAYVKINKPCILPHAPSTTPFCLLSTTHLLITHRSFTLMSKA